MTKSMLILSTIGVIVLGTVLAFATSHGTSRWPGCGSNCLSLAHWGGKHRGEYRVDNIADVLELNTDQKERLQALHHAMQEARRTFADTRTQMLDDVTTLMTTEAMERTQVEQVIEQFQSTVDTVTPHVAAKLTEFHAVLTPEQRSKIVKFIQKWKDRVEHKVQHHT